MPRVEMRGGAVVVPRLPKKYKVAAAGAVIALLAFAASAIWGENGYLELQRKRAELEKVNRANFALHGENERLRTRIQRLLHDDAYLERYAREEFGLVRPGEILYRLATPTPRSVSR